MKNKLELTDKFVHEFKGKWSDAIDSVCQSTGVNMLTGEKFCLGPRICNKEEFQQRARELGYVNGYRYGVEYPTNGSKPDLPDDVIIQLSAPMRRGVLSAFAVSAMYAAKGATFKITDERYKPEDASYLDEYFAVQGIDQQKIKNTLISDIAEQGWYCYETQKALRLPPVGVECETFWPLDSEPQWYHATVMYASGKNVVLNFKNAEEVSYKRQSLDSDGVLFRPLDYNRKAEMERKNTIDHLYYKYPNEVDEGGMALLELLYDAGFLRMPEDK